MNKISKEERYELIYLFNKMGKSAKEIALETELTTSTVNRVIKVITAFENDDFDTVIDIGRASGINRLIVWCENKFNKSIPEEIAKMYRVIAGSKNTHSVCDIPEDENENADESVIALLTKISKTLDQLWFVLC